MIYPSDEYISDEKDAERHVITLNGDSWTNTYRRGDHAIQAYFSDVERLRTISEILDWMNNEEIFYYFAHDLDLDVVKENDGPLYSKIRKAIERGRLRICDSASFYCKNGVFREDETRWIELIQYTSNKGYSGFIVVGDLSWAAEDPSLLAKVINYEIKITMKGLPKGMTAVCQYDARRFNQKKMDFIHSIHELQIREGALERNFWLISQSYY